MPLPIGDQENQPWNDLPTEVQQWFMLKTVGILEMSCDFMIIFLALTLWHQPQDHIQNVKKITRQMQLEREKAFDTNPDINSNPLRLLFFVRHSAELMLIVMFILGTIHEDILSLGYVVLALYFIWNNEALLEKGNALWRWIIVYNFFVIFIQVQHHCTKTFYLFF